VTRLRFLTRRRLQTRAADTPRSSGRLAATRCEWQVIRLAVVLRAGFRCQACHQRATLDVHHVLKRAQGGSDFDLDRLVALCRRCHDLTDAPYIKGRLVVTSLADGAFRFERLWRSTKWDVASGRTSTPESRISDG
jgi:5-methylcytosine-specific restriction endonuclease McrA